MKLEFICVALMMLFQGCYPGTSEYLESGAKATLYKDQGFATINDKSHSLHVEKNGNCYHFLNGPIVADRGGNGKVTYISTLGPEAPLKYRISRCLNGGSVYDSTLDNLLILREDLSDERKEFIEGMLIFYNNKFDTSRITEELNKE